MPAIAVPPACPVLSAGDAAAGCFPLVVPEEVPALASGVAVDGCPEVVSAESGRSSSADEQPSNDNPATTLPSRTKV